MQELKIHKARRGFTWFTLCGTISKMQPTEDNNKVTCKTCLKLIKQEVESAIKEE